jgi:hypothetical protein
MMNILPSLMLLLFPSSPTPTSTPVQTNFLLNGGFEKYSFDLSENVSFDHWTKGCDKPDNLSPQLSLIHSGLYSIAFDTDACVKQNLSAVSIEKIKGQPYELSCWINYGYSQGGESGSLQFSFKDGDELIQENTVDFPTGKPNAEPTWQKVTLTKVAPLKNIGQAYISIYANAYVVVDSCQLTTQPIRWGAEALNNTDRPQDTWRNNFNNITPILVQENFYSALNQCPENDYCVLEVNQLTLDQTIYLHRSKTKIIGSPNNKVTFPIKPTIDWYTYFVVETNASEVIIEGLNIDGQSKERKESNGLLVNGINIKNVIFDGNNIHHIYAPNGTAHGIAVLGAGESESTAISQVIIKNNRIHDMKTGFGENITMNGNVKNWEIKGNTVKNINNIAIDAIGGEGTVPPITLASGRIFPSPLDSARYGFIENNAVLNMSTVTNPAYENKIAWAAAIYVDGAHHIHIANNEVINTPWGYEVGSENCVVSHDVTIIHNTAKESWYGDALFGGYAEIGYLEKSGDLKINCNPEVSNDSGEGHGYVENISVIKNNFLNTSNNPSPNPDIDNITLQFRLRKSIINQIGIQAEHTDGYVVGDENSIRTE